MSGSVNGSECDVYFCKRPIEQGEYGNLAAGALSVLASTTRPLSGDAWDKHWFLVFDYGGDRVLVCDADEVAGELTGRRYWKKTAAFWRTYPTARHLGKHNVPEQLLEKLLKSCASGPYHLVSNNCQTWVVDLLRELGIKAPEEEQPAEKVVDEVLVPGAALIGGAIAVLGAGFLAAQYFRGARRNDPDDD